jgi:hypothetical protein
MTGSSTRAPKWFYAVSALALLWNLMGVAAYIGQVTMSPEALAALPEAERALYETTPAWAIGAFAIAVFGGALGSLLLVLKKRLAGPVLIASFAGIIVQMIHSFFVARTMAVYGPGSAVMPAMVLLVGAALIWLAARSARWGWLA